MRGSVYIYDGQLHTTRLKTATGELQPTQDLAVFIDVRARDVGTIAAALLFRGSSRKTKFEVVEELPDGSVKVVSDAQQISNPDRLQVAVFRGDKIVRSKPASLRPRLGAYVFDSRRYEHEGVVHTERHLGHKVSTIKYKD